jgi:hypothetical protein
MDPDPFGTVVVAEGEWDGRGLDSPHKISSLSESDTELQTRYEKLFKYGKFPVPGEISLQCAHVIQCQFKTKAVNS